MEMNAVLLALIGIIATCATCGVAIIKYQNARDERKEKSAKEADERYQKFTQSYIEELKAQRIEDRRRYDDHREEMSTLSTAIQQNGAAFADALRRQSEQSASAMHEIASEFRTGMSEMNGTLRVLVKDVDEMKKIIKPSRAVKSRAS